MDLEEMKALVDVTDEAGSPGHEVYGPDAARSDGTDPLGDPMLDVAPLQHRPGPGASPRGTKATGDAAPALAEDLRDVLVLHLKGASEAGRPVRPTPALLDADSLLTAFTRYPISESRLYGSKAADWQPSVLTDGNLSTGQNPASSGAAAGAFLKQLC